MLQPINRNGIMELIQKPQIKHDLIAVGKSVSDRLSVLNINGQIATEDTVKSLKTLRAELTKELTEFENQRKAIKEAVMQPYNDLDAVYKTEVSEKYKDAIEILKDKISYVENEIKANKKAEIVEYFTELCLSEEIDFVSFDQVGIDVNLSVSMKQLKEKSNEFIEKIKSDLLLIETQQHQAEILTEYKKSLNCSLAIRNVTDRKEAERKEAERLYFAEQDRRKSKLLAMACTLNTIAQIYEFSEDIFVLKSDVEKATKQEFESIITLLETQIKAKKEAEILKAPIQIVEPVKDVQSVQQTIQEEPKAIAVFEVEDTIPRLKALGEFLKQNGYKYKNV